MTAAVALLRRYPALKIVLANPVVVRDLRAQMRGTKSYWYQGAYLLLLGVLAVAGYAQATGQSVETVGGSMGRVNIVDAQGQLETFYYFIFATLAALICLIAPALTASSIVGERQRLSLDLLVTTPLTASQLLVGKLISSIAFLGLLLALSLPASALCVLLGGATLGDVLRVYALLAIDGLVLAGIGLFFSCAVRVPMLAIVWTYGASVAFLVSTFYIYMMTSAGDPAARIAATPLLALAALNPFVAIFPNAQQSFLVAGVLPVPVWLGALAAAILFLRLLVTAGAYRMAVYGGEAAPSLRRQILVVSGVVAFAFMHNSGWLASLDLANSWQRASLMNGMIVVLLGALPFLSGLFVPASAEDAPPGAVEISATEATRHGRYNASRLFHPEHAGSLPYFHLWLATCLIASLVGVGVRVERIPVEMTPVFIGAGLFISGIGFLLWAISRCVGKTVRGLSAARAVTFGVFTLIAGAPMLFLGLSNRSWEENPLTALWLFNPLLHSRNEIKVIVALIVAAGLSYLWGVLFLGADAWLSRRRRELS